MSDYFENGSDKGYAFQYSIRDMLEEIITGYWWCSFSNQPKMQGTSREWTPDMKIAAENTFTLEDLNLAAIECKYTGPTASASNYWTSISKAYVELNDIRLKSENQGIRFYLLLSRSPVKGDSPKLDYSQLFKSIGVELVNADNPGKLASFKEQIHQLCEKSNPLLQMNDIEQSEIDKIPCEVLERTNETIEKRNRELKNVLDRFLGDRR